MAYFAKGKKNIEDDYDLIHINKFNMKPIYTDIIRASTRVLYIRWIYLLLLCGLIMLFSLTNNIGFLVISILSTFFSIFLLFCRTNQEAYGLGHLSFLIILISVILFLIINSLSFLFLYKGTNLLLMSKSSCLLLALFARIVIFCLNLYLALYKVYTQYNHEISIVFMPSKQKQKKQAEDWETYRKLKTEGATNNG